MVRWYIPRAKDDKNMLRTSKYEVHRTLSLSYGAWAISKKRQRRESQEPKTREGLVDAYRMLRSVRDPTAAEQKGQLR